MRVLLVEDSPSDARIVKRLLGMLSFPAEVVHVERVSAAIAECKAAQFEAAFLDLALPDAWGIEVVEAMVREAPAVALIVLTGSDDDALGIQSVKAGAQDFVRKDGWDPRLLERVLRYAVERQRLLAAYRRAETERARLAAEADDVLREAEALLSSITNVERCVYIVAQLAVPRLADACAVHLLDKDGSLRLAAMTFANGHGANGRDASEPALGGIAPEGSPIRGLVARGLGMTEPQWLLRRAPEVGTSEAEGPPSWTVTTTEPVRAELHVPLVARSEVVGVLTLTALAPSRTFGEREQRTASRLATLAALAVHSADLYGAAQAAVRTRDEFLATASHELRTPLAVVALSVEGMYRAAHRGDAAQRLAGESGKRTFERAFRQTRRLVELVNNMLDASRIAAKPYTLERENLDLCDAAREIVDRYREHAALAGSELSISAQAALVGSWDRLAIDRVLTNLVSNAIKYAPGKPIEVSLGRSDARAVVAVRDHGQGIARESQERIFQAYERANAPHRGGGIGLGLFIVARIVEAHGGSIRVDSVLGEGSKFTVELPLLPPRSATAPESRPSA